ncbi:hypothetical protein JW905_04900 [bacterium]|nr:hypothetical protein [candidate division CSSED10-310 bacterium]
MAIICALRFDHYSGAMVGDEEYWLLRRRKSYYNDTIHKILDDGTAEATGIAAAYGGWGHPAFHHEVVRAANATLRALYAKGSEGWTETEGVARIAQLGHVILSRYHHVIHRRVDETLRFLYGFTTDDLTRGYFEENGSRFDIAQDSVKSNALKIVNYSDKRPANKTIFDNRGVLIGYDPTDGFGMFNFNGEKHVLCFVSGGFEAVGKGQYASGQAFARFLNQKSVAQRRAGVDRVEGMVQVIHATHMAEDYYHEAGGNVSIVYIDGRGKSHDRRYHEIVDDRARLASELVRAFDWEQLTMADTYELVDGLVFQSAPVEEIEHAMFERCRDAVSLELILRGYKHDWTRAPAVPAGPAPVTAPAKPARKKS